MTILRTLSMCTHDNQVDLLQCLFHFIGDRLDDIAHDIFCWYKYLRIREKTNRRKTTEPNGKRTRSRVCRFPCRFLLFFHLFFVVVVDILIVLINKHDVINDTDGHCHDYSKNKRKTN